ncbi:hypothetical protein HDF16_003812 [Granulicella aggregans]|uniref:Uncharacterized protein n=1 Tax=Granulicella aggregans TaxID=474949 RepID=A0A7W8E5A4_9BACT|nr:hypothetical protein [Granulicella aggregans]MBB5059089.1 hypothetical protein [Granulicella aggregans]
MTTHRKTTKSTLTVPNGPAGMEDTAAHLQLGIGELNEAAFYFETLGMDSQRSQIDAALDQVGAVLDLLGVLLGRELEFPFGAYAIERRGKAKARLS